MIYVLKGEKRGKKGHIGGDIFTRGNSPRPNPRVPPGVSRWHVIGHKSSSKKRAYHYIWYMGIE